jgi:hypothetical protein
LGGTAQEQGLEVAVPRARRPVWRNAFTAFLCVWQNVLTAFRAVWQNTLTAFRYPALLTVLLLPTQSLAQTPSSPPPTSEVDGPALGNVDGPALSNVEGPGPYVIDVRGTTIGVPQTSNFYPDIPDETTIPARGFGAEVGAHFYPIAIGTRRRIGFGIDTVIARGTATTPPASSSVTSDDGVTETVTETFPAVAVTVRIVSAQVSINFGTSHGWSYLSVGGGPARVKASAGPDTLVRSKTAVNAGAGARWFITDHIGVGFDLRAHWLGSRALFAASAGFSLK